MSRKFNEQDTAAAILQRREGLGEHHHGGSSSERLLNKDAILSCLEILPGQVILDAGCGGGYMAREFVRLVGREGRVYALDPDQGAIARLRAATKGTNLLAMVGDVTTETGLAESSFDLVYLSCVFHGFTPDQIRGFNAEVRRLLAPRGRLAVVEFAKRAASHGPPLERRISAEELRQVLALRPLRTVELDEHSYLQIFENRSGA